MTPTIFLLSPANLTGVRAQQLRSPRSAFAAAAAYRSPGGVAVADAFTYMSALYFRGKAAYARKFAASDGQRPLAFVIAPGFGLVPLDWRLDAVRMRRMQRISVDPRKRSYRKPLEEQLRALAAAHPDARFVLLGSIATGKYTDVLAPILGDRLHYPASFAGIGDMSRGALMLRAAASGEELAYAPYRVESGLRRALR